MLKKWLEKLYWKICHKGDLSILVNVGQTNTYFKIYGYNASERLALAQTLLALFNGVLITNCEHDLLKQLGPDEYTYIVDIYKQLAINFANAKEALEMETEQTKSSGPLVEPLQAFTEPMRKGNGYHQ